jgi:hypothetical protein
VNLAQEPSTDLEKKYRRTIFQLQAHNIKLLREVSKYRR